MPPRKMLEASESPDPLLLYGTSPEIVAHPRPHTPIKRPAKRARAGTLTSVNIDNVSPPQTTSPSRTPRNGATPINNATLIPRGSPTTSARKGKTPVKPVTETPVKSTRTAATSTLGESARKKLPTPKKSAQIGLRLATLPRYGGRASLTETKVEDESPTKVSRVTSSVSISRQSFLANEQLKRQREARNFKYTGDADAPRLTRSGKVVGEVQQDEYDAFETDPTHEEITDELFIQAEQVVDESSTVDAVMPDDEDAQVTAQPDELSSRTVDPLPESARPIMADILSTLTSTNITHKPKPFHDELQNDTLLSLTKLLQGTIDRAEGNSALIAGPRGSGKTRTMARALSLIDANVDKAPIVVRLSGHVQTNDRLAIREMGRQIAEAEGTKPVDDEAEEDEESGEVDAEEYAPTTLPSHLLALLTAPSPRAIIIILEEFDLFTEHARQALLYCLFDVVQSVKGESVAGSGRGIAVIGITSRIDTLLLMEKRVKSRFSHRMWRVTSPVAPGAMGWRNLMRQTLIPWDGEKPGKHDTYDERKWRGDWEFAVETLLNHDKVSEAFDRLTGLTTDVRNVFKPFVLPISEILHSKTDFMTIPMIIDHVLVQIELAGWGLRSEKLKGLPHPALGILIIAKHLHYAGREEFNFAQVEEEYLRFSRTKLVGIGKTRWPIELLRTSFDHLLRVSLLTPCSNTTVKPRFAKVRCTLSPHEIVGWFKGEGGNILGPEMTSWGRIMGGHA